MKTTRIAAGVTVMLGLAGCVFRTAPTEAKYAANLDKLVGSPIEEIVERWGYPVRTFEAPSGRTVYVWVTATSEKKATVTTPLFGSYVSTGGETVSHGCSTFFEVAGAKKNVVKITFDGDRCKAN